MIYTVTLNPALDRTVWVSRLQDDVTNRIQREERYPGGKGIGVSRVLTEMGIDNRAMGFAGGFHGRELESRLMEAGVPCDFTAIRAETRTNIVIHEVETGRQVLLASPGPRVRGEELQQLFLDIERAPDPGIVTIGGSLPDGVSPEVYPILISSFRRRGARVILDAEGEALRVGVKSGPYAIKPNLHELSVAAGTDLRSTPEILDAADELRTQGAGIVLVSLGKEGMILVSEDQRIQAIPPAVKVRNTIGAGDSSVAGFISGLASGEDLQTCLRYAVAAGTASTLQEGTALATRDDIMKLFPQIQSTAVP